MWYARFLSIGRLLLLAGMWAVVMLVLAGCQKHEPNSNRWVTVEAFRGFSEPGQTINSYHIRNYIDSLIKADKEATTADIRTRSYYLNDGKFLWIDRKGVDHRADTLLFWLKGIDKMGFSMRRFCVENIEDDLLALRSLRLDTTRQGNVNAVLARLEYRLTKAYFRYAAGQRFGFTNPAYLLNRLDTIEPSRYDSVVRPVRYRGLFDVPMDHLSKDFFNAAIRKVEVDSLSSFLSEVQPRSNFYDALQKRLAEGRIDKTMRAKILCNMERCRWRTKERIQDKGKYVIVNIPSMHLMAIDHHDTLTMRIGCGSLKTKTPLLVSRIKRMDVNPQWVIPRSIIDKDVAHHVGDRHYFDSRRYYVVDRRTGKEVDFPEVTFSMLRSHNYSVVQRGGKGNSLGRLVFRFDNNFSVFLHDTSSRGVFSREDRSVSHGCVRVEKPFELGVFLMHEKNQQLIDKLQYSMTADSLANRKMIVRSIKVEPQVPLFITYYTLFPMAGGRMVEYADIYGYDKVIYDSLKPYL